MNENKNVSAQSCLIDKTEKRSGNKFSIAPLDRADHQACIINIATDRLAPDTTNPEKMVDIGKQQMESFERIWPIWFVAALSNQLLTMPISKKHSKLELKLSTT